MASSNGLSLAYGRGFCSLDRNPLLGDSQGPFCIALLGAPGKNPSTHWPTPEDCLQWALDQRLELHVHGCGNGTRYGRPAQASSGSQREGWNGTPHLPGPPPLPSSTHFTSSFGSTARPAAPPLNQARLQPPVNGATISLAMAQSATPQASLPPPKGAGRRGVYPITRASHNIIAGGLPSPRACHSPIQIHSLFD